MRKNVKTFAVPASDLINQNIVNIKDLNPYLPTSEKICVSKNIQVHYLSYYLRWDPQECYYYAVNNVILPDIAISEFVNILD